jgi:D-alanyl-D-alanine carboxypeptidase/D-alanyl-D-alanine-endopeptidase (penicillin-binding protein 4)
MIVQDGEQGLYSRSPELSVTPASTQKLLVAAAALSRLGPDFRYETKVVAPAAPVNGTVGELWLVGAGDPLLATAEYAATLASSARTRGTPVTSLAALADALAAQGVKTVAGGIHGDDSRYETLRYLPGWTPQQVAEANVGPLGALTVNGGLEAWEPKAVLAADPAALTASHLARLLVQRGTSAAASSNQTAPAGGVVLARVLSAPLAQVVSSMLSSSDNLAAELLVREIDRQAGGTGTSAGGTRLVVEENRRLGVPTAATRLEDGSGLAPANRTTCGALLGILGLASSARFSPLATGLPVAGVSGTLAHRYRGTPAAGHLAAKTGWIRGAAGLVGRLNASSHPVRFAFVVNGVPDWPTAKAVEDRVVAALVTYPEGG